MAFENVVSDVDVFMSSIGSSAIGHSFFVVTCTFTLPKELDDCLPSVSVSGCEMKLWPDSVYGYRSTR